MTDSEKGATKEYLELRIKSYEQEKTILKEVRERLVIPHFTHFLDSKLGDIDKTIFELEGVARHLKIELWTTIEDSKS